MTGVQTCALPIFISHRGQDGVKLPAGGEAANPSLIRWKATFSRMQAGGQSFSLAPVVFDAVPGGEIDLTMAAPVAGAPEGVVRGPRGTSLESIIVDGSELVFTAVDDAGSFEIARIPLDDVVRAEADAAAAAAVDGVETVLAATVDAANAARDDAKGHADRAEDAASTATSAAGDASQSRDAAATSEANAAQSETNAAQSEANAAASEQAAATSASNAASSESNAQDSAAAAATSASEAAEHADRAEKAADPTELRDEITQQLAYLVDGAPEDLDTIREVAEYAQENRDITDALNAAIGAKANKTHTHTTAQVEGLDSALADKAETTHTHALADVTGLQSALNSKANTSHTHTTAQVTGLDDALDGKASTGYVDTAVAAEKARTVGMVWMVETEDQAKTKEPSCQKGDFIQVAQTGNIYQVV